jgi:hypothetical protein
MATSISSFANKDSVIVYPEVFNYTDTTGTTQTLKPNSLASYTNTSFYFDKPSIAMLQGGTGTSSLIAFQNLVTALNSFKTTYALTLDIKVLKIHQIQWAASSYSYIAIFSIFRI